jgi:hypothetical protein
MATRRSAKVGGSWIASDLVAGVEDVNADGFGNSDDAIINSLAHSIARIASITIGGIVDGTAASGDHYGFVSHAIGSFKADGFALTVPAAPGSIALAPTTGDVTLRSV